MFCSPEIQRDLIKKLTFNENNLIPAIAQQYDTQKILMMAWMSPLSIEETFKTGFVHYYSRSRQKLWKKGEQSGHLQSLKRFFYDCDGDTVLLYVDQKGVACHTGKQDCFFNEVVENQIICLTERK